MSFTHPKFGLVTPDNQTKAKDLGAELKQMGATIEAVLAGFDYNGADPDLVLARVASLEAALTRRDKTASGSGSASAIATGTKLTDVAVSFPIGRFDTPPTVIVQYTGGPGNAQYLVLRPTAVTKDGFTAQVYNTHSSATLLAPFNWIAVGE